MYRTFLNIHSWAGLTLLIFIVMYFFSGVLFLHPNLIENRPQDKTSHTIAMPDNAPVDLEELSVFIQDTYQYGGKRQIPRRLENGSVQLRYFRPGEVFQFVIAAEGDSATVTHMKGYARTTMLGFHILHGYGNSWLYNVWALMMDLASIAMIVFAVTGFYLWYKTTQRKLLGWIFLGCSWGFFAMIVGYLILSP
jgi:hypothetical protein